VCADQRLAKGVRQQRTMCVAARSMAADGHAAGRGFHGAREAQLRRMAWGGGGLIECKRV